MRILTNREIPAVGDLIHIQRAMLVNDQASFSSGKCSVGIVFHCEGPAQFYAMLNHGPCMFYPPRSGLVVSVFEEQVWVCRWLDAKRHWKSGGIYRIGRC